MSRFLDFRNIARFGAVLTPVLSLNEANIASSSGSVNVISNAECPRRDRFAEGLIKFYLTSRFPNELKIEDDLNDLWALAQGRHNATPPRSNQQFSMRGPIIQPDRRKEIFTQRPVKYTTVPARYTPYIKYNERIRYPPIKENVSQAWPVKTAYTTGPVGMANTTGPVRTAYTTGPVRTAYTTGPVRTAYTRGPVRTANTRGPVRTANTRGPVRTAYTAWPVGTTYTTRPVRTSYMAGPVEAASPTSPVETAYTAVPVETPSPAGPVPVEAASLAGPVGTNSAIGPIKLDSTAGAAVIARDYTARRASSSGSLGTASSITGITETASTMPCTTRPIILDYMPGPVNSSTGPVRTISRVNESTMYKIISDSAD